MCMGGGGTGDKYHFSVKAKSRKRKIEIGEIFPEKKGRGGWEVKKGRRRELGKGRIITQGVQAWYIRGTTKKGTVLAVRLHPNGRWSN